MGMPSHHEGGRQAMGNKKVMAGCLGGDIRPSVKGAVTYSSAFAVPSAWRGLTSLFGMGRGGAPALSPP